MEVKPTTLEHVRELYHSPEVYPMTSPRGRVFIIYNDQFDAPAEDDQDRLYDREQSEFVLNRLKQLFSALDFVVVVHHNLSVEQLFEELNKETSLPDHKEYGIFIMIVISRGDEDVIHGSDSRKVAISNIKRQLSIKNFPAMACKPKLVIIQAGAAGGADNSSTEVEGDHQPPEAKLSETEVLNSTMADFAVVQASHPGYKSLRDTCTDTFMIQSIIDALQAFSCQESVQDIIMRVRKMVLELCEDNNEQHYIVQTVHWTDTLSKKLYLFPGISRVETPNPVSLSAASSSSLRPAPTSAPATTPPSLNPAISDPSAGSSSGASVKLTSLVKLRYLQTISTPDSCHTVTLDPDGQVLHGGWHYDSLNGTREDGLVIECIRAAPDNHLIMSEGNYETETAHIVTYKRDEKPTATQKNLPKAPTPNTKYRQISNIQVQYKNDITPFTKIDDLLIQAGPDAGKLCFIRYSTGELIRKVTHRDMERPCGICHITDGNVYVTDRESDSIFSITLNNDERPTITKLNCEIFQPAGITSHEGLLVVLSNDYPIRKLYIMTTRGETVTTIELPECKGGQLYDLSINTRGVVAIANAEKGVQIYKFE